LIDICGRKIKVQTGAKSQTVNICSSSNIHGQYDYIARLRPPSVSPEILINQNFNSIRELVEYLESHHEGVIEKSPGARSASTTRVLGACHPRGPVFVPSFYFCNGKVRGCLIRQMSS